ncbi:acyltransferase [Butyrivibrio sp. FCS014]|uniref:acyltransferase n=1 Tax=Butyrivibrio sp. FCS014 TaxID=1408304 RepID=UPI0018CC2108|nr:acyltransferase [Butyrivibrio sp. FCS014]
MVRIIKYFLGFIRGRINHINVYPSSCVYIGKRVNVVGGRNIHLSDHVTIRPEVDLWCGGASINIGNGTEIGQRDRLSIANSLYIGKDVLLSPNVYITDCDHEYRNIQVPVIKQGIVNRDNKISIGDGAYIGINAVIVGNISIGQGTVVGANSVVTRDIPDYCVAVGAPARVIKRFNEEKMEWEKVDE